MDGVEEWVRQESLGKEDAVTLKPFNGTLRCTNPRPTKLVSSRKRVLRGAGATRTAKRR